MSFDPNLPLNDEFIIDTPAAVRQNFTAIVMGDSSFSPLSINYGNTTGSIVGEPQATSTTAKTYLKEDPFGNLNLFTALPNAAMGGFLTTLFPPLALGGTISTGSLTLYYTYLPGGLMIAFGWAIGVRTGSTLTLSNFSQVFSLTGTLLRTSSPSNAYPLNFVSTSSSGNNPPNTFKVIIQTSSATELWRFSVIVLGLPTSDFLKAAFANSTPVK